MRLWSHLAEWGGSVPALQSPQSGADITVAVVPTRVVGCAHALSSQKPATHSLHPGPANEGLGAVWGWPWSASSSQGTSWHPGGRCLWEGGPSPAQDKTPKSAGPGPRPAHAEGGPRAQHLRLLGGGRHPRQPARVRALSPRLSRGSPRRPGPCSRRLYQALGEAPL